MLAALLAWQRNWEAGGLVALLWLGYVLFVRLSRCGVETRAHKPCRWRVRGLLATCEYHRGDEPVRPVIVWMEGSLRPRLMWPRRDLARLDRPERQPGRGASDTDPAARAPGYERTAVMLAAAGVVVALAAFLRDLIAG